jgi:hypothetical protein
MDPPAPRQAPVAGSREDGRQLGFTLRSSLISYFENLKKHAVVRSNTSYQNRPLYRRHSLHFFFLVHFGTLKSGATPTRRYWSLLQRDWERARAARSETLLVSTRAKTKETTPSLTDRK